MSSARWGANLQGVKTARFDLPGSGAAEDPKDPPSTPADGAAPAEESPAAVAPVAVAPAPAPQTQAPPSPPPVAQEPAPPPPQPAPRQKPMRGGGSKVQLPTSIPGLSEEEALKALQDALKKKQAADLHVRISASLPADLDEEVRDRCKEENRSINSLFVRACRFYLLRPVEKVPKGKRRKMIDVQDGELDDDD